MAEDLKKYAVVSGANRGIGFEICRQLASQGVTVVLTARDEKRGLEAVEKLRKESGLSDQNVVFHQLDVADSSSIDSLAEFIKTRFKRLDILVNNAAISATIIDGEAFRAAAGKEGVDYSKIAKDNYELAEECLKINYYGAVKMCEAFAPLLQLSKSPRVVNVSSSGGKLKNIRNKWAKEVLSKENLTEDEIKEVLLAFVADFKQGFTEAKGWPKVFAPYALSKAALNAYTRILAKKYPCFCINAVCPGFVKTDMTHNAGFLSVEEGAASPARLAQLSDGGPSGRFFYREEESEF